MLARRDQLQPLPLLVGQSAYSSPVPQSLLPCRSDQPCPNPARSWPGIACQEREVTSGIPTGFTDLDSLTGGLRGGQVVAARPTMGKSTLAVGFLRTATITHDRTAALFTLEMSGDEVQERIVSADARVGYHHRRGGASSRPHSCPWAFPSSAATRKTGTRCRATSTTR